MSVQIWDHKKNASTPLRAAVIEESVTYDATKNSHRCCNVTRRRHVMSQLQCGIIDGCCVTWRDVVSHWGIRDVTYCGTVPCCTTQWSHGLMWHIPHHATQYVKSQCHVTSGCHSWQYIAKRDVTWYHYMKLWRHVTYSGTYYVTVMLPLAWPRGNTSPYF